MKTLKTLIGSVGMAALTVVMPLAVHAQAQNPFQQAQTLSQNVGTQAGIASSNVSLPEIVGRIINILLGFIGIVLLLIVLYAGFQWMTAGGDSKKVEEAKQRISNAVVGLIILVAAFAISNFVLGSLVNVTQ
jgi:hypothetical protein